MRTPCQYMLLTAITIFVVHASPTRADEVHATSTIVEGHLCVSDSNHCVNPEPYTDSVVSNADIKVRDDNPAIYLDDDFNFVPPQLPPLQTFDWMIANDNGAFGPRGALTFSNGIDPSDPANWNALLVIESNGPSNQLYLDNNGNVGINTNVPSQDLSIASASPTIALFDTDEVRTWEINSDPDGSRFDIRDATASTSPLVIEGSGPDNSLYLNSQGYLGLGLNTPARQLHLRGPNALFRMDRSYDTAAFMLVRVNQYGVPIKNFVIGTNASGPNVGEFVVNDLGTEVGGPGARRMTIDNAGNVFFTGNVTAASFTAPAFTQISSRKLKDNIVHIDNSLALTEQLQGVRFNWKDSGRPALGFIAEEVAEVLPEVVDHDEVSGEASAVNYTAIVPVLVEAIKEQQSQILEQQSQILTLKEQVSEFQSMRTRLTELELQIGASQSGKVLVSN